MSDFTTPEGCETSVTAPAPAASRTQGVLRAPAALNRLLMVFGLWIAVAVFYWPSSAALDALWTAPKQEEAFTHGYLVLLISLWLVVRDRKRLASAPLQPVALALIPVLLLSALWVWSWRAAIQESHMMLVPMILSAAVVATFGTRVARVLAFPIGYLYFAMPVWSDINGIVQGLSAKVMGVLLWLTGIPAYMAGDMAHLPGGNIEIAESCSGLHALIVGLALAALYGKVSGEPWRRRLAWLGSMGVLSLIVNWVRIFTVLVAAYATNMQSSLVRQHYWLGWWLFAAAFVGFLWWTGRQPQTSHEEHIAAQRQEAAATGPAFSIPRMALTLAALALLPALAYGMDWAQSGGTTAVNIEWPAAPPDWSGPEPVHDGEWRPYFVSSSGQSLIRYTDANRESVEAFAVAYRAQTQNAKLLSYWNRLLGAGHASLREQSTRLVNSPSGQWRETVAVDGTGERSLIWSRYRVGNRLFVEPRLSQLWYGLDALMLNSPLSSLTALRSVCSPDCKAARSRLRAEAAELQPSFR
jgi:EpsI family protein